MRNSLLFLSIIILISLLYSCDSEKSTVGVPAPDIVVLRVGALNDDYRLTTDDPGRVTVGMSPVNANVFDSLTYMNSSFQIEPMLATSWEYNIETKTWRFNLRKGVVFHDGQVFTSKSVIETMNRVALNNSYAGILKINQNSTTAIDEYTVDIKPYTSNLQLPGQISHPIFGIRAPGSNPFKGEHIGTGPFKITEYVPGKHIIVEKNSNYWGQIPSIDKISFIFIPDPDVRVAALQNGDVDIIYSVPLESTAPLVSANNIRVLPSNIGAYQAISLMLNGTEPYIITQDSLVREAIGSAIDRQQIIDQAFSGFASSSQTIIPQGILGPHKDQIKGYEYNPDIAQVLLEKAGWFDIDGDGIREKEGRNLRLEMVVGFPTANGQRDTPEIVRRQLRDVGIEIIINTIPDTQAYEEWLQEKKGDMWLEIGNQNSSSPSFLPEVLYYGKDPNPNIWQAAFAPGPAGWPEFDSEIDASNNSSDFDKAISHAANAMHVLIDEARVVIPLVGLYRIWLTNDDVRNFEPHPAFVMARWNTISLSN
jgi:peptide/nickel transport system substrate-binding protein